MAYCHLNERKVVLKVGGGVAEKVVSKGCPQSSILGPLLWNVLFNGLLELDMGEAEVVAYADDEVVAMQMMRLWWLMLRRGVRWRGGWERLRRVCGGGRKE